MTTTPEEFTPHARMKTLLRAALEQAEQADITTDYSFEIDTINEILDTADKRERIVWSDARRAA